MSLGLPLLKELGEGGSTSLDVLTTPLIHMYVVGYTAAIRMIDLNFCYVDGKQSTPRIVVHQMLWSQKCTQL